MLRRWFGRGQEREKVTEAGGGERPAESAPQEPAEPPEEAATAAAVQPAGLTAGVRQEEGGPTEGARRSWLARLRAGLSRTRAGLVERVAQVVRGHGRIDEELFEQLEEVLIMADVGVKATQVVMAQLRERVRQARLQDPTEVQRLLAEILAGILRGSEAPLRLEGKPAVALVVGVNGTGKTTSVGKLAWSLRQEGRRVLLGAADTFRAAAIEQLEVWAHRAGAELVKHQQGADPAAVAYDAVRAGIARGVDVVLLDTAGRLQTKVNLMHELNKVYRVVARELGRNPDEVLLVVDATTGQNALSQVAHFKESVPLTGLILTKLDSTAKGGIVVAVAAEAGLPVKLIGVGEQPQDLRPFVPEQFVEALFG